MADDCNDQFALVPLDQNPGIVALEQACRALDEARRQGDLPRAKLIRDQAEAFRQYARTRDLSLKAVQDAGELKLRAERVLGELLAETVRPGNPQLSNRSTIGRLPDGVSRDDSSRWQRVASVPHEVFEQHIASTRDAGEEVTTAGVIRLAPPRKPKPAVAAPVPSGNGGDRWRVECADCLEWFAEQSADSVNLVFGSPPYERARLYLEDSEDRGIARDTGDWVEWMADVFQAALRCCTGLVAFVVEGQTKEYRWSAAPALLMAELVRRGVAMRKPPVFRRVGIPGSGGPDWLRNDYEFVVCATRGGRLPWSDNTAMGHAPKFEPGGDPSHRQADGRRVNDPVAYASAEERGNVGPHRARRRNGRVYHPPERSNPGNVIDCGAVGGGNMGDRLCHENEAPFPESLAEFFIRSFCPPRRVVCDPFSGSGTTGATAIRLGRRFAGCDVRESQVLLSRRRMANAQPPLPLES